LVAATRKGLCAVSLGDTDKELESALAREYPAAAIEKNDDSLGAAVKVLLGHLEGVQPHLNLPLDVQATAFQRLVWEQLRRIPYGDTRSYADIAKSIGRPEAVRAVARAIASNRVALVVPCHRVIREDKSLGGYRWGVERKKALLKKEGATRGVGMRGGETRGGEKGGRGGGGRRGAVYAERRDWVKKIVHGGRDRICGRVASWLLHSSPRPSPPCLADKLERRSRVVTPLAPRPHHREVVTVRKTQLDRVNVAIGGLCQVRSADVRETQLSYLSGGHCRFHPPLIPCAAIVGNSQPVSIKMINRGHRWFACRSMRLHYRRTTRDHLIRERCAATLIFPIAC